MYYNTSRLTSKCHEPAAQFVELLAKPGSEYLTAAEFLPLLQVTGQSSLSLSTTLICCMNFLLVSWFLNIVGLRLINYYIAVCEHWYFLPSLSVAGLLLYITFLLPLPFLGLPLVLPPILTVVFLVLWSLLVSSSPEAVWWNFFILTMCPVHLVLPFTILPISSLRYFILILLTPFTPTILITEINQHNNNYKLPKKSTSVSLFSAVTNKDSVE